MATRMNNLSCCILLLFLVQCIHVQGISIELVTSDVEDVSEEYFLESNTFSYVDNDIEPPSLIGNITIIKSIPEEAEVSLTLHGYSMGEYRVPVGMEYSSPICDLFEEKLILAPAFKAFGFTPENCPLQPGIYENSGYYPDLSVFPDAFPRNQYLIKFKVTLDKKTIGIINVYTEVL